MKWFALYSKLENVRPLTRQYTTQVSDIRTRGFTFIVPIGKVLTMQEEKNDVCRRYCCSAPPVLTQPFQADEDAEDDDDDDDDDDDEASEPVEEEEEEEEEEESEGSPDTEEEEEEDEDEEEEDLDADVEDMDAEPEDILFDFDADEGLAP